MYGAIIGDLAGSIYEYDQTKGIHPVKMNKIIEDNAFYSDDTILTIATMDALLKNASYDEFYRKYYYMFKDYKPDFKPYFKNPFSPGFINWAKGKNKGDSVGNGALMRISPIPSLVDDMGKMYMETRMSVKSSHDSKEAMDAASILATIIYQAKNGLSKYDILEWQGLDLEYIPFTKFNTTCDETLNNCLYALFSATSFEDAIERTLYMGGDTDTNCAIVGSVAEHLYGLDDSLIDKCNTYLPDNFVKVLKKGYRK